MDRKRGRRPESEVKPVGRPDLRSDLRAIVILPFFLHVPRSILEYVSLRRDYACNNLSTVVSSFHPLLSC
jgi:hypothetical protein